MKFKKDAEPVVSTDGEYYDLCEGYIKPEELLENQEDIDKVYEALRTIQQFVQEAEDNGLLEYT